MALPGIGNRAVVGFRKRYRSNCEDEISEFTPLSKRINNLHINNTIIPISKQQLNNSEPNKVEVHREIVVNNERLSCDLNYESSRRMDGDNNHHPQHSHHQQTWISQYSPDLSPTQNPYYYESNRLLFELYLERSQRTPSTSQNQY